MLEVIHAIEDCLEKEAYFGALQLSLSIPDICGQVEFPSERNVGKRYRKWYDQYFHKYENPKEHFPGMMRNKFDGFMCYTLRNSLFHSGIVNSEVDRQLKAKYKVNGKVSFFLFIPKNNESSADRYALSGADGISNLSIQINIIEFCRKMVANAKFYYQKNEDKFPQKHVVIEFDIYNQG